MAADLRKKENSKVVVEQSLHSLGGIDIVINNAAF